MRQISPCDSTFFLRLNTLSTAEFRIKKYSCTACGYAYNPEEGDPDSGIPPSTVFEDIPDDWSCPVCGVGKEDFEPEE